MNSKIIPTLSGAQRASVSALQKEYNRLRDVVAAYDDNARKARKRAIREEMRTAPADRLLTLGTELQLLDESFTAAKRGAKQQIRELSPRIADVFLPLLARALKRVDDFIAEAKAAYDAHFALCGLEPEGVSPAVARLNAWKVQLTETRDAVAFRAANMTAPIPPSAILPFEITADDAAEALK